MLLFADIRHSCGFRPSMPVNYMTVDGQHPPTRPHQAVTKNSQIMRRLYGETISRMSVPPPTRTRCLIESLKVWDVFWMSYEVVNPTLELIDPCPDIHALFVDFNERFFEGTLAGCEVKWSPRMYSCAGVCSYEGRNGFCSIRLSLPLLKLRPRKDLIETLLHEMIHAFLFVTQRNRDRDGHGPEFQYHMYRINQMANTKITIYHSFHDEVAVYKQHIWRCNGPCRERRPFYGYVKRSSNRAPGPNDLWWNAHKSSCNGTFLKIKEPEGYGQRKRKKMDENSVSEKKAVRNNSLDRYFASLGSGQKCGTVCNQKSMLPNSISYSISKRTSDEGTVAKVAKVGHVPKENCSSAGNNGSASSSRVSTLQFDDNSDSERSKAVQNTVSSMASGSAECPIVIDGDCSVKSSAFFCDQEAIVDSSLERFVTCPCCGENVIEYFINEHLDGCTL